MRHRQVAAGAEVIARAGAAARVVRGRCLAYGDGITFWPLREMVDEAAAILVRGHAGGRAREDHARGRRRGRRRAAGRRDRPEPRRPPTARDLLGGAQVLRHARAARPADRARRRHPLGRVRIPRAARTRCYTRRTSRRSCFCAPHGTTCSRSVPTGARATARCAWCCVRCPMPRPPASRRTCLAATGLPADVVARIVAAAEGNPLYVEQMLSMLVEAGR